VGAREELRRRHVHRGDGIEGVEPRQTDVRPPEFQPLPRLAGNPCIRAAGRGHPIEIRPANAYLAGDFVGNERCGDAASQDRRGSRGILHQVQVAKDRPVAEEDCPGTVSLGRMKEVARPSPHDAHQPDAGGGERGVAPQRQLEIGQRPQAQDRERTIGYRARQRRLRRRLDLRRGVHPVGGCPIDRPSRAAIHRDLDTLPGQQGRQLAGGPVGHLERSVAEDRGDAHQFDRRRPGEEQDRQTIVGVGGAPMTTRRVAVDPDPPRQGNDRAAPDEEEWRRRHLAGAPSSDGERQREQQQSGQDRRRQAQPPQELRRLPAP
jgi:hypothetical protein